MGRWETKRQYDPDVEELVDSLTARELAETLESIQFRSSEYHLIRIDRGCRDYLVWALRRRQGAARD